MGTKARWAARWRGRAPEGRVRGSYAIPTGTLLRGKGGAVSNYPGTRALNWEDPWKTGKPGNPMRRVQGTGSGLKCISLWGTPTLLGVRALTEIHSCPRVWSHLQSSLWPAGPHLLPLSILPCSNSIRGFPDKPTIFISCLLCTCRHSGFAPGPGTGLTPVLGCESPSRGPGD